MYDVMLPIVKSTLLKPHCVSRLSTDICWVVGKTKPYFCVCLSSVRKGLTPENRGPSVQQVYCP